MSPGVTNFVHDLVAMAQAMDELPKVKEALAIMENERNQYRELVGKREEHILDLKAEVETLVGERRKEADRADEAELRFLELEEKHVGLTKLIQAAASAVGMVDKPAEPASVTEANPTTEGHVGTSNVTSEPPMPHGDMAPMPQGQSEPGPTLTAFTTTEEPRVSAEGSATHRENASSGTGTNDPLPPLASGTTTHPTDAPSTETVASSEPVSATGGGRGKYTGKRWSELSASECDDFWKSIGADKAQTGREYWEANGGSHDDYYK